MPLVKCPKCGSYFSAQNTNCPKCGQLVKSQVSKNPLPNPSTIPTSGPMPDSSPTPVQIDKQSIGLNIISFLIPFVGWILYFVKKGNSPIQAKGCGLWGTIGFIVNLILLV